MKEGAQVSVSDASIDKWKANFGEMEVSEAERLEALGREHATKAVAGGRDARQLRAE